MKNLKILSHTFLRTTFSLFLALSTWQVTYGMKREPIKAIPATEEKKRKLLDTEISADNPFLAKIQQEFFYGNDLDTLEKLLSKPEKELSSKEREKLYKQIESFNAGSKLIPTSPVKAAMQNLLYAFQYIPQLRFPQAFFTPQPYQRLTDLRSSLDKIIEALIKNEQEKIYVCCYHLERINLTKALVRKKEKGISIEVIVDQSQLTRNDGRITVSDLQDNNISVVSPQNDNFEQMHHKFFIFKKNLFNKSLVITGSYNPTSHGNLRSWDDIIILDDPEIVKQYIERFEEIKKRSQISI